MKNQRGVRFDIKNQIVTLPSGKGRQIPPGKGCVANEHLILIDDDIIRFRSDKQNRLHQVVKIQADSIVIYSSVVHFCKRCVFAFDFDKHYKDIILIEHKLN